MCILRDGHYSLSPPSLQVFLKADIHSGGVAGLLFSGRHNSIGVVWGSLPGITQRQLSVGGKLGGARTGGEDVLALAVSRSSGRAGGGAATGRTSKGAGSASGAGRSWMVGGIVIILCCMSRRSRGCGAVDPEKLSIAKSGAPRAVHPDTILVVWEGFHHYWTSCCSTRR